MPAKRAIPQLPFGGGPPDSPPMLKVKDTLRATVNLSFDGRVFKVYHGPDAEKRFNNEVKVLRHLEARGCGFVQCHRHDR